LPFFRDRYAARTVTGAQVGVVQAHFRDVFNLGPSFPVDGRHFDVLLDEGDRLTAGGLVLEAMHTPGHTPAHMSWRVGDAVFLGDTLFAPDYGTARCDFPGGDAGRLYDSIQKLLSLPDGTTLYLCHDYRPNNRDLQVNATIDAQRATNIHIGNERSKEEFVAMRQSRDATLLPPALLLPSLQVNVRGGRLPKSEDNSVSYLKIPLDQL
jgi:glyoxylase-like metal-dependent hydrolase (beta-lactamase superfamily II)